MQLKNNLIQEQVNELIIFFNLLINPNRFLLKEKLEEIRLKQDIRSSSRLRIVGKKIVYFFRTLFLVIADNIAIVASWMAIAHINEISNKGNFILSEGSNLDNTSWLLILLVINLAIFCSSGLYSTKDKSRRIGDSLYACSLSYITFFAVINIFDRTVGLSLFLALNLIFTWLFSIFLIGLERYVVFQTIKLIRQRSVPLRRKILLVGVEEDLESCQKLFKICKCSSTRFL